MGDSGSEATTVASILARLASRNAGRSEADIQADVRDVLLYGNFDLGDEQVRLESPAPDRRRIDVEVGALVIECKKDLRGQKILADAEKQLAGYLTDRESENRSKYVGILTDGISWHCYRRTSGEQIESVSALDLKPSQIDERRFRWWLGSLLATERQLAPTAFSIEERLGSDSPAAQLALKELADLWRSAVGHPEVQLKRALWAKLLRTALGTQFHDDDALFLEHTYLVLVATLIAHIVIGFEASDLQAAPSTALSGQLFAQAGVRGVGEAGFFDWVVDLPSGESIVIDIARRLSVFRWNGVEHDVLKALYQSVISPETRHRLGEYYTPDWLAQRMVAEVITDPLHNRVLDPACGSGTFVFHSVRCYLDAAEKAGLPLPEAVAGVAEHVFGLDLHPVAVVLAQVTYLLAVGTERVTEASVPLSVPVYLGDSMRWETPEETFLAPSGDIMVPTGIGGHLPGMGQDLRFPASVVSDPSRFDRLVDALASRAADRAPNSQPLPISGVLSNFGVSSGDRKVLEVTYHHLCQLHDEGRDHIWGFFVRNQARPTWFSSQENRVDVIIGNPPWLSYRYMPKEMQELFRTRAMERHLWAGGKVATQQDLSAYFVARSIELYLKPHGRFGFVMPFAALSRIAYEGFRKGYFSSQSEDCVIGFDTPWDLDAVKPDPFPVPSSVVFGDRLAHKESARPLPTKHIVVAGRIHADSDTPPADQLSWNAPSQGARTTTYTKPSSPYADRFRQGATLVPRMLVLVEVDKPGPLQPKTQLAVRSRRGRLDKKPWTSLPDNAGVVEKAFVRQVFLGEHCLPFRMLDPVTGVIPFDGKGFLSGDSEKIDRYSGLAKWWRHAERTWDEHKGPASKLSLLDRINYHNELGAQFPSASIRVVYTKAGNYLTAATITSPEAVIDHMLYWGSVATLQEARYLTAILNAPALGEIVEPYQSRGAFGARHFDKYVWYPPIPEFDVSDKDHRDLAELALEAEVVASETQLPSGLGFQRARKVLREGLQHGRLLSRMDALVKKLLS